MVNEEMDMMAAVELGTILLAIHADRENSTPETQKSVYEATKSYFSDMTNEELAEQIGELASIVIAGLFEGLKETLVG